MDLVEEVILHPPTILLISLTPIQEEFKLFLKISLCTFSCLFIYFFIY